MGILRILCALLIAIGHYSFIYTHGLFSTMFTSGGLQGISYVHVFFLQSGFLTQQYFLASAQPEQPLDYYKRRLLKLYSLYWIVLIFMGGVDYVLGRTNYLDHMLDERNFSLSEVRITNLLALNLASFYLWPSADDIHAAYGFDLLVGPAWSLTMQVLFILLAPFICLSRALIFTCLAISAAACLYFIEAQNIYRQFIYTEMVWFFIGAAVALIIDGKRLKREVSAVIKGAGLVILCVFVSIAVVYQPLAQYFGEWQTYIAFHVAAVLSLLPAKRLSDSYKGDANLSLLAWGIYLWNMPIANVVNYLWWPLEENAQLVIDVGLTLMAAMISVTLVMRLSR